MMPRLEATEIQPGRECHVLGFKKMPAKCKGIATKGADIGIQVKRPFRLDRNTKTQLAQSR